MSHLFGLRFKRQQTSELPAAEAHGETVLAARGVSLAYNQHTILDQVSLEVKTGELLVLAGPNGAGKSTLLSVLSGDVSPQMGEVYLFDKPLSYWTHKQMAQLRAVLLQQNSVTFPFLSSQIVEMGRSPWRGTDREAEDEIIIKQVRDECEIADYWDRSFITLSGGERARVSLARVLAQQTPIMLLDEPTAALDIKHQEMILSLTQKKVRQQGCAAIVVLHDLNVAAAYADKIALISDRQIQAHGTPQQVLTSDLLSRIYDHPISVTHDEISGLPRVYPKHLSDQ